MIAILFLIIYKILLYSNDISNKKQFKYERFMELICSDLFLVL